MLPKRRGSRVAAGEDDGGIFCSLAQALWQLIYQIAKAPPELFNLRDFHSFFQIIIYYFATYMFLSYGAGAAALRVHSAPEHPLPHSIASAAFSPNRQPT